MYRDLSTKSWFIDLVTLVRARDYTYVFSEQLYMYIFRHLEKYIQNATLCGKKSDVKMEKRLQLNYIAHTSLLCKSRPIQC